ncbi:hypothetical protein BaRGS_00017700 [Batillaria attramentaria]|uniref:Secreted protein n=1 Tax=Batillaria attramentaria TaxID=370345 RepID=A0ABD0KVU3_9CAEN
MRAFCFLPPSFPPFLSPLPPLPCHHCRVPYTPRALNKRQGNRRVTAKRRNSMGQWSLRLLRGARLVSPKDRLKSLVGPTPSSRPPRGSTGERPAPTHNLMFRAGSLACQCPPITRRSPPEWKKCTDCLEYSK